VAPIGTKSPFKEYYLTQDYAKSTENTRLEVDLVRQFCSFIYTDKFHVCNDTGTYRIEIADRRITSVSNVTGENACG